jgi:hypothetical protein
MPRFRADYDVRSSLVLPIGCEPFVLRGDNPAFELTIRNADPDGEGHIPSLVVQVVADCDSIDRFPAVSRAILAEQLDVLSFATHSTFMIDRCRRVLDWEPHQKSRRLRPLQTFDPLYPPDPDLRAELLSTAQKIILAKPSAPILRALRCFRYGVIQRQPEDQFQQFWLTIETIAEEAKDRTRVPIPCPKCQGELFCANMQRNTYATADGPTSYSSINSRTDRRSWRGYIYISTACRYSRSPASRPISGLCRGGDR